MQIPNYFLKRPPLSIEAVVTLEELLATTPDGAEITYTLDIPKWQFLCYLCDHQEILLHGSNKPDITEFEPRQANDVSEFGNQNAIYAASDGIWPIYFAIVDREQVTFILNGCFHALEEDGTVVDTYYYFSVDEAALPNFPWQNGMVYLLPRNTFERQPYFQYFDLMVEIAQWASPVAVKPIAKLRVTPEDFPFLREMNSHNPRILAEKAAQDPNGFPWRE